MGQGRLEEDRVRLNNSERVTLELFLIVYPLSFIKIDWFINSLFLWLIVSVAMGAITYVVFGKKDYTPGLGVVLSLVLTLPFFFIGLPLIILILIAGYSFWRIHDNFAFSKMKGWPFLVLNIVVFITFYLFTKPFFMNNNPGELMMSQLILFGCTTVLYFVVRFVVVGMIGHRLNEFRVMEVGKIFGGLLGIGFLTYVVVYFLLTPVRNGIIAILGFLFGGIFTFILKGITPALDAFIDRFDAKRAELRAEEELEEDLGYSEFNMQDDIQTFGNTLSTSTSIFIIIIAVMGLLALYLLLWKRKNSRFDAEDSKFVFKSSGNKKKQETKRLVYDYSKADGQVRKAFKGFEELAQTSQAPRLQGETVKEWFSRMGWRNNEKLLTIYDKARYGTQSISEEDGQTFNEELEKIKNTFLKKDV